MLFLTTILVQANITIALATDFTVDIITDNKTTNHNDPSDSLIISIPVSLPPGSNVYSTIAVVDGKILPFSLYKNNEVIIVTSHTGTYSVINNSNTFSDTVGHWAENSILFISSRGLFSGTGAGMFTPNAPMTRSMFVQVLANIDGVDLSAYSSSRFSDVSADSWYMPAIEWAADLGLVDGINNEHFDPEVNITREQMARTLMNYIEYKQYSLPANISSSFNDEPDINTWALDAVNRLHQAGIIDGRAGNIFAPQDITTRAEVATVFAQFIVVYVNHASTRS
jgi:hypothetical protein